jgi:flavocytochrome c
MGANDKAPATGRRGFLGTSLAGGALLASPLAEALAVPPRDGVRWDETVDVVVVGSGLAGLSAGITVAEAGKRVLVLEKMAAFGGSSVISGGTFAACNTPAQKAAGIKDSVEQMYADLMKAGERLNAPELVRTLAENSAAAHQFLVDRGAKYDKELRFVAGHSVLRCFQPTYNMGLNVMQPLLRHMQTLSSAQLRLRTKVDEIVRDKSGAVVGVKVRAGYLFNPELWSDDRENRSGVVRFIRARQGVIFATGGFSRDREFRKREFPQYEKVPSTVQLGATAGALKLLMAGGARAIHLAHVRFAISIGYEDIEKGVLVDQRTGKRFISEGASRMGLSFKVIEQVNAGSDWPALIYDAKGLDTLYDRDKLHIILNNGEMRRFDSLAALAQGFKMPVDALTASIANYNAMLKAGKDTEFGKDFAKTKSVAVENGPFFACPVYPKFNYSQGGIAIDARARAISGFDDTVIPGLYIAGEASGGVHGAVRVTGCSTVDCTVFGRIAGAEAVRAPAA